MARGYLTHLSEDRPTILYSRESHHTWRYHKLTGPHTSGQPATARSFIVLTPAETTRPSMSGLCSPAFSSTTLRPTERHGAIKSICQSSSQYFYLKQLPRRINQNDRLLTSEDLMYVASFDVYTQRQIGKQRYPCLALRLNSRLNDIQSDPNCAEQN
ncbi:hypothetical protein T265_03836 [Opisthorchis viverrini]|uniref:Uncharacterized protein n=1 Tax=Opisthorchis viverrini TaxID=6198 RepID=A0A075AHA3_OPIVI|nr:hypothetical protein T265_03836 [Opisthorchis viverrini]KER29534.1 hypothetical protein T265_03836 [Opisthorchis viverrini]